MTMKPAGEWTPGAEGLFLGIPHQKYLDAPGISSSGLSPMMDSPAHFEAASRKVEAATQAQSIGTYLHSFLLTPDVPLPGIAVKPDQRGFMNSNEGKAWKKAAGDRGDIILSEDEYDTLKASLENLKKDRTLCNLVQDSWREVSAWTKVLIETEEGVPAAEVLLKCRFDFIPKNLASLVDLKSSLSAGPDAWGKACVEYGYHRQAAHYLRIWNALNPEDQRSEWIWAVIEKPYGILWWTQAHPAAIQQGERELDGMLKRLVECKRTRSWPGRPEAVTNLPIWYYKQAQV